MGSCALSSQEAEEQGEVEQTLLTVGEWSFPLQMRDHLPIIIALVYHNILTVKGPVKESEVKQSNIWLVANYHYHKRLHHRNKEKCSQEKHIRNPSMP